MSLRPHAFSLALAISFGAFSQSAWADSAQPPWVDSTDIPISERIQSVLMGKEDMPLMSEPRMDAPRRGSAALGAHLPFFAARRGSGCAGRWLLVGPLAWVCQTQITLSELPPSDPTVWNESNELPFRYFFVGSEGSTGYSRLELAEDAAPDEDFQPGFALAIMQEGTHNGIRYGRTHHGLWVPLRDLIPARGSAFHGEEVHDGALSIAWVLDDKTYLFQTPDARTRAKDTGPKMRFELIQILEEKGEGNRQSFRIDDSHWIRAKDVRRPQPSSPPEGVPSNARWLDVDLASQTLVAYEGAKPVFATLVSTGKGAQGTPTATPKGVHRIWVKLPTSTMDNLDDETALSTYSIEDVPYVQFFAKGVGLHGTFWHNGFGRVRSHGCVNLAPLDAQRLFAFTSPHVPAGWSAALPTPFELGTVVRVRLRAQEILMAIAAFVPNVESLLSPCEPSPPAPPLPRGARGNYTTSATIGSGESRR